MAEGDPLFARYGKTCPAGTILFRQGETGEEMFVLQSGKIRITKSVREGSKILAVLGPGEFFGEMAILNGAPRSATAEAIEDAKLVVINGKTFESMVVSNAEIAVRLIKKLARRLAAADALIEVLMHRDPKARVILGLAREADVIGQTRNDGRVLIPITESELAEQVGLGPEEVSAVVKRLGRLGMVQEEQEGYVIHDVGRLHEFLEFLEEREVPEDGD